MRTRNDEWADALAGLIRVAHAAGVSDAETSLWYVQHIDSSLSRLVRREQGGMQVIANVDSPGALRDLSRMYPPREKKIFSSMGLALYRKSLGFKFVLSGSEYHIDEMTIFQMFRSLMDEYKYDPPRML